MKNSHYLGAPLSSAETMAGIIYLALQIFVLPEVLRWINAELGHPMNEAEVNFVFYLINFMAMLLIFHNFLGSSARQAMQHPMLLIEAVILGLVFYYICLWLTMHLVELLVPHYTNYNDEAIFAMGRGNAFLMLIATVVLVPPAEECLFRGVIFRNLYSRNKIAAYAVSIALFAIIHILGYIGRYSPLELVMAVLQYLPAGLFLGWSYARANTIFAPIFVHAAINYITIRGLR